MIPRSIVYVSPALTASPATRSLGGLVLGRLVARTGGQELQDEPHARAATPPHDAAPGCPIRGAERGSRIVQGRYPKLITVLSGERAVTNSIGSS